MRFSKTSPLCNVRHFFFHLRAMAMRVRVILYIAALAAVTSCGGSDGGTAPLTTGTARYIRDANTCTGIALSFDYFMDGATVGSSSLAPGQSASYTVAAGTHVFSARVSNTTASFAAVTGTVTGGGTFNYTMTC